MALFSRARGLLKQTLTNNINKDYAASTPSIYQMIRCMSSKLFFGGISFNTDETSLREECSKYGEVIEARIIVDRDTGNSRGFGFVTFASAEDASSAIQALDQKELHGRTIRVNYATDRTRGYTGVGGGGGYGVGDGGYGGGGYGGGNYGSGSGGYGGGNYGGGGGGYGGRNYEGNAGSYGGGNYGGNEGGYGGGGGGGGAYASNGGYTSGGVGGGGESNFGGGVQYPSGNNFVSGNQNFGVPNGVNYMPEGNNGAGAGAGVQILNGNEYGVADVPPYNSQQGNLEDDNDHHQVYADKRA